MDDRTRTLVVTTIVLLIILALIAGVIFYISRIIRTRQQGSVIQTSPKGTITIVSPSPSSTDSVETREETPAPSPENTKSYKGQGFTLNYPKNWGLLTCSNSQNFELDPTNSQDQLKVNCDVAQKPITVLVGGGNCQGQQMSKGGVTFTKSKTDTQNGADYAYCTKTTPALEITHRVSPTGSRATSKEDFSSQIEEMISKISFGNSI